MLLSFVVGLAIECVFLHLSLNLENPSEASPEICLYGDFIKWIQLSIAQGMRAASFIGGNVLCPDWDGPEMPQFTGHLQL